MRKRIHAGPRQTQYDIAHGHASLRVGLWIKEQFGVHHVVCGCAAEVRHGHRIEVCLGQKHRGTGVVQVQKALQVRKRIGSAQRLHAGIAQGHAILLRQFKNQLRLQRAFNVDV